MFLAKRGRVYEITKEKKKADFLDGSFLIRVRHPRAAWRRSKGGDSEAKKRR